jgi:glycosyltransferase involved in cell wall biosynthesis
MINRSIEVDLVVNSLHYSPMLQELPKGVNFVNLGCSGIVARLPRLMRYMRTRGPDCLLSAGHSANELSILAKVLSSRKTRVVVSEHTCLSTELNALATSNLRRFAIQWFSGGIYRFADGVIAVSDAVRSDSERLLRMKPGTCQTIYNPVNFERIFRLSVESIDHPWFQADGPPIVLGIGRLEEQKDFTNLLEAFAKVRTELGARLLILGEGSQREYLTARIVQLGLDDCVRLLGFVPNPYPYLKNASAFALSSKWEGLPTVLLEALAFGVPIVSTDCPGGSNEILAGGKYGALVPMSNPRALAEAILIALRSPRPKVPDEALAKYRINDVVDQYLAVLTN